jgi:hypothetical protein
LKSHFVSFFPLISYLFYLILWVNIQLNVHFYIFFQITIYSDWSLTDEIWWTFYKRSNWASRKNIKYGLRGFFLLSFELVNCKCRSRIYTKCNIFADDPGKLQLFFLRASLNNVPIYYDMIVNASYRNWRLFLYKDFILKI